MRHWNHHTFVYQYTCIVYFRTLVNVRQLLQAGGWSPDRWPRAAMAAAVCPALHSKNLLWPVYPTEFLFFQKNFKLVSSRPAGLIADQRIFLQQQSEWILFYCWYSLFCRIIGSLKIVYLLGRIQSINRNFGTEAGLPPLGFFCK